MKFSNLVLPDILDNTTDYPKLKKSKRGSIVPSLPETEEIRFSIVTHSDIHSTDQPVVDIINQYCSTNQVDPTTVRVHLQGRIYLHEEVYQVTPTQAETYQFKYYKASYTPYHILRVQLVGDSAWGTTLPHQNLNSNSNFEFIQGWQEKQVIPTTYPYSCLKRYPKYKFKPVLVHDRPDLGLYNLTVPRTIFGHKNREVFLAPKRRLQVFRYLRSLWIPNKTVLNLNLESDYTIYPVGYFSKDKPRVKPVHKLLEDTLKDQLGEKGYCLVPQINNKRSYLTAIVDNNHKVECQVIFKKLRKTTCCKFYPF